MENKLLDILKEEQESLKILIRGGYPVEKLLEGVRLKIQELEQSISINHRENGNDRTTNET